MNVNSISSIEDVLCFFLSVRRDVQGLYGAWLRAIQLKNKSYTYVFRFLGLSLTLNGKTLVAWEAEAKCLSLDNAVNGASNNNVEGIIKLLFKLRMPLEGLYAAFIMAAAQRNGGLGYCYYFRNPLYGTAAQPFGTISGSITITNCNYRELECKCACSKYTLIMPVS
jgi:hypothetical protein